MLSIKIKVIKYVACVVHVRDVYAQLASNLHEFKLVRTRHKT